MSSISLTTRLEAVNTMLRVIGMAPINSLSGDSKNSDVVAAENLLDKTQRQVLLRGWDFNTEDDFSLAKDVNGYINVGSNYLVIDFDRRYDRDSIYPVQRGTRIYDRLNNTYVFTQNLSCTVTLALEWDELPEAARQYIMIKAARQFQDSAALSSDLHEFTSRDEADALDTLEQVHARTLDASIFEHSDVAAILTRSGGPLTSAILGPSYREV